MLVGVRFLRHVERVKLLGVNLLLRENVDHARRQLCGMPPRFLQALDGIDDKLAERQMAPRGQARVSRDFYPGVPSASGLSSGKGASSVASNNGAGMSSSFGIDSLNVSTSTSMAAIIWLGSKRLKNWVRS